MQLSLLFNTIEKYLNQNFHVILSIKKKLSIFRNMTILIQLIKFINGFT